MKRFRAPLMVGLVGTAGVVAMFLLFGTVQKVVVSPGQGYKVHADFEDVSGLVPNSRVTMSGFPIGTIDHISLITLDGGLTRARVTIRILPDIKLYKGKPRPDGDGVINGATITRRTATMLGDYYLEISPGYEGPLLGEGDAIPNVVGETGFNAIATRLEKASDIFPKIQKILTDVSIITDNAAAVMGGEPGKARMERIAQDIEKVAADIAGLTGDVREFARREVTGSGSRVDRILGRIEKVSSDASKFTSTSLDPLNRAIRNVEIITADVREALKSESGNEPGLKEALAHLKSSLDNLDQATASLASIARKVDSGQGTLGKIVNDDKLITKTEQVVEDVGGLVSSVTRLETSVGFRSEFNIQERALKNYLGLRFQPDPGKYYLVELVFDPRGKTSTLDRLTLTNDPSLPPALAERVTETRMDIKFSLEFAKRLAFVTGRFGLIESTGGLGLDFEFFKDSLKFSFDLFDFGADRWPRFKALAAWEFVKHFYVTAGVDDIANKRGRDYFAGAGFRFTDDDLKVLLMVAPTPAM